MLTQRLGGDGWGHLVRVLAPLGALALEGWPALIGTLLIQEMGVWLAGRLSAACERTIAQRLFLAAYGLRMVITLPNLVGEWLVRIARGDGIAIFPGHQHLLDGIYPYLLMGIHALFGFTPLLPKLLNVGLAALSAVLIFTMARRIFDMPAAMLAALGATLLPTLAIWSVASLKECLVLFAALLGLRRVQILATEPSESDQVTDALVALLAVMALLLDLRSTLAAILFGLMIVVFVARSRYRPRPWQLGFTMLALVILIGGGVWFTRARTSNRPLAGVVEDVVLQIRHRRAQEAAGAISQVRPEVDSLGANGSEIPTMEAASDAAPFTMIEDVVAPLGYALLSPTPWQAHSFTELAASAEMPIWYVLLAASCLAWRAAVPDPRQRLFVACLVVYGLANWLVLAASEGNVGNLLRHRLTLDPVLLILGGAGVEWLWRRSGRPFPIHLPAPLVPARGER
ncbi:MAG: hypothetical protein LC797_24990 [Chloroflexi bacterium]|nr:hypothetical protein [Chloroflexota bacterium]